MTVATKHTLPNVLIELRRNADVNDSFRRAKAAFLEPD
jgi:hypothetical protein